MPRFIFNKLVRDKIVSQQIAGGAEPSYRRLDTEEHASALITKLHEEADELASAAPEDLAGEIADIQQVLDDLCHLHGIPQATVAAIQAKKLHARGGFADGIFIESVETAEDDQWTAYYRKHPERYPELQDGVGE